MRDAEIVKIAKALADPTRLKMLQEIRDAGRLTCSQVCEKFTQSQPTISHHIKTLEGSGLIAVERQGQFHVLSVNEGLMAEFAAVLGGGAAATGGSRKKAAKPAST